MLFRSNVHHFAGMVEAEAERLGSLGYRIKVSDEREELLETGGGLYRARKFFDKSPFMVYNADIVTDLDLAALYSNHLENKSLATLSVRSRPGNRVLLVDHSGVLGGWYNRSTGERIITGNYEEDLSEIAFSGIHVIDPEIFAYMNEGVYSLTTLYLQLASAHKISTFRCDDGYWFDIGTPESLEKVRGYLDRKSVV